MRYDELRLPIGDAELHLRFHSRFTVLAGLSGAQRRHLIDAVTQLNRGALRGGSVALVDSGGRRRLIDDLTGADPTSHAQRSAGAWRSLLAVGAEDLGLPRASDDPGRVALQRELDDARRAADQARHALTAAREERRRHAADLAELTECEAQLADLGTESDRHRHNRARALVELEQARASFEAVDAAPFQIARDERLIAATTDIQALADEWADIGERLDQLKGEFGQRPPLADQELADLIDVPDEIPESLAAAVAERDRLRAQRNDLKGALEEVMEAPSASTPTDARVLTLGALDQETLWLTHRDVLLATEALHEIKRAEEERMLVDPTEREQVEQAHDRTTAAAALADRRWLPSVLTATIAACAAAMLLIADLWVALVPLALVITLVSIIVGVGIPRLQLRGARQHEGAVLTQVDAADIGDYLARFNENRDGERWQRAERVIDDYQSALREWTNLVGDISVADATVLEERVQAWVARSDRTLRERETTKIRRQIDRNSAELQQVSDSLRAMLEPFGLDPHSGALAATLQDRVLAGRMARLQVEITDTAEAEGKLTHRLGTELSALGFEAGSLAARIASYGRELDAARHRVQLRREAPDRDELEARIDRLEVRLAAPAPPAGPARSATLAPPDPAIVELRERRERLAGRTAAFANPDTGELKRRLDRIEGRIAGLETSLATERGLVVANPVDHLVETLVRYRPTWPTTEQEPTPAFLDDPFAATSPALKRQLLDAVVEVTRVVQVVLLTDDPEQIAWARQAANRGLLNLVAPMGAAR
jgi:hypothetical protein